MKMNVVALRYAMAASMGAVLLSLTAAAAFAQQITGTPGSPSATTINGEQIPPSPQKFRGVINRNAAQSKPMIF